MEPLEVLRRSLNLFLTSGAGAMVNLFLVFITVFFFYYLRVKVKEYAFVFAYLTILTIAFLVGININKELMDLLGFIVLFGFIVAIYKVIVSD